MTERQRIEVFNNIDDYRRNHPIDQYWLELMEALYSEEIVHEYLVSKGLRQ